MLFRQRSIDRLRGRSARGGNSLESDGPEKSGVRFGETLALELKSWLDPKRNEHKARIVKALIALRNHGGGSLLVGVGDDGVVVSDPPPFDFETRYHPDQVQELVSRHASVVFSVATTFRERDGRPYVRMDVEPGVRTPVRVKTGISVDRAGATTSLLAANDIPVRTLESNGRPSTSSCGANDWERLMTVCFDNREADIGRFIRRHLNGAGPGLAELIDGLRAIPATGLDVATGCLDIGAARFEEEIARRELPADVAEMIAWGGREVAVVIEPAPVGFSANGAFLQRLLSSLPRLTSYPPLLEVAIGGPTSGFVVRHSCWEGLLAVHGRVDALTFDMADPQGRFYERRLLLPDVIARANNEKPKSYLGERETITDVAEAIVTVLAFATALGIADEEHNLAFAFRWSGLAGRLIDGWFLGSRAQYVAEDDVSPVCRLTIAGDTPPAALAPRIGEALQPLFETFRGYMEPQQQIEETLAEVIESRSRY